MSKLKVVQWPVEKLIPYARNPRKNDAQVDRMVSAIKEFGFRIPVVAKSDGTVVDGHLRLKAAQKLGLKEVPVALADELTEAQVKAFRLLANKSANWAEWDDDLLRLELDELKDMDFDLSLTGFDSVELDGVFASASVGTEGLTDADDVPEVQETPVTQEGDIWLLGKHRLMCGDSTDAGSVCLLMQNAKAALVLTDPPYGVNVVKDNKVGADFGVAKKGKYEPIIADDSIDTAKKSFSICEENSDKQIIWGGNYFTNFLPFSDGWLVWDKRVDSGIRNTFADAELAWCSFHTPVRVYHQLWNGMIREGEHEKRVHPTQKPVGVLSEILSDFSSEKDIVLDLFGGSGSTLIACEKTGRVCRMMELAPHYCDVIVRRWQDFTGQKATLESNGKTFDEVAHV